MKTPADPAPGESGRDGRPAKARKKPNGLRFEPVPGPEDGWEDEDTDFALMALGKSVL